MNNEIPETEVLTEDEQIASILEHLPAETEIDVEVPSRGIPYFGKEGLLRVRPMTFEDEKSLSTGSRTASFNPANYLLSKCVSNVDVDKLLLLDKLFLLLKVRELSYGADYKVGSVCPQCNYENTLNLEIDKLLSVSVPKDFNFMGREVFLKGIKKNATVSFLTVGDENFLDPAVLSENIWRYVTSIDGVDDQRIISKVISQLPIMDIHILIKELMLSDYGVQPSVRYVCDSCNNSNLVSLPLDENFFSVN